MLENWKLALAITVGILTILYFGFSFYVASVMTSPLSLRIDTSATVIAEKFENIDFRSSDGIDLKGWFFPGTSNKVVIMVTGLIANRVNTEYLGPMIARELIAKGYSVITYDTRAHGLSGGKRVGFGSVEGNDIVGAVSFAETRGFKPKDIGIIADSTGSISTLMVIDKLKAVGATVLDSPAAAFAPIISNRLWQEKGVPTFFDPAIFFFDKFVFGVDINSIRPIDKIGLDPNRKFLFLHGALDQTIPIANSQQLLAATNKNSKLVIFNNGSHIETYKSDPALYRSEVYSFLDTELGK